MDAKIVLGAFALFFSLSVFVPFGIYALSGSTAELNGTISDEIRPAYDSATGSILTFVNLMYIVPLVGGLVVVVAILLLMYASIRFLK